MVPRGTWALGDAGYPPFQYPSRLYQSPDPSHFLGVGMVVASRTEGTGLGLRPPARMEVWLSGRAVV